MNSVRKACLNFIENASCFVAHNSNLLDIQKTEWLEYAVVWRKEVVYKNYLCAFFSTLFIYVTKLTVSGILLAEQVNIKGLSTRALKNISISLISLISLHFLVHFDCIYEAIFYITDCGRCSFVPVLKSSNPIKL